MSSSVLPDFSAFLDPGRGASTFYAGPPGLPAELRKILEFRLGGYGVDSATGMVAPPTPPRSPVAEQLDQAREQLENFVPTQEQWDELDAGQTEIDQNRQKLEDGKVELDNGQKEIDRNRELLDMSSDAVMVNDDSSTGVVGVTFDAEVGSVPADTLNDARSKFDTLSNAGLKVSFDQNMEEQMPNMNPTGEIIGILIALIILVVMLG